MHGFPRYGSEGERYFALEHTALSWIKREPEDFIVDGILGIPRRDPAARRSMGRISRVMSVAREGSAQMVTFYDLSPLLPWNTTFVPCVTDEGKGHVRVVREWLAQRQ